MIEKPNDVINDTKSATFYTLLLPLDLNSGFNVISGSLKIF
jgi:hypothetical protein